MELTDSKPNISTVVIGIDVESTVGKCLQSIKEVNYPQEKLEIIYVDGGSKDRSVEIAKSIEGVQVVELKQVKPTPGRGRNAGWKLAKHNIIQFLDADTTISPDWFNVSHSQLNEQVVAVCGKCTELFRDKNCYHLIGDIEWGSALGSIRAFGGIVLINKEILQAVGGFDDTLVAGEEPDLSYRIRQSGGVIVRIKDLMVYHDLNMSSFKQYWKRCVRTGYAYAEVSMRYIGQSERFWVKELTKIILGATVPSVLVVLGWTFGYTFLGLLLALGIGFRNLRNIPKYKKMYGLSTWQATVYAVHLSFVVYPQMVGVLKYFFRRLRSD